ncbi:serine/threonine-protein kinase [Kitasatospora sp. NPDC057965]|uniref:serine/threonine-protein kinase n=1 Tax=Kitasatospora sp. NPDC057965 TaxID=3346291 RepID=UPI0036DA26AE
MSVKALGDDDPLVLGPFRLLAVLGQGGMGRVYLGRRLANFPEDSEASAQYFLAAQEDTSADTLVAVKVIKPDSFAGDAHESAEVKRARFLQEVTHLQSVIGPRVPAFQGADPDGGLPWLAIDYIHGPNLSRLVHSRGKPFNVVQAAALGLAMTEALQCMHEAEVLHRDLKPANVVLGPQGPVVVDFGLAVLADRKMDQAITATGTAIGTVAYMPLEQYLDTKHVSKAADVYSLAATLFFASVGRPPYPHGPSSVEPPAWHGVPALMRAVLEPVLVPDAETRPNLMQVRDMLLELLVGQGVGEIAAAADLVAVVEASGLVPDLSAFLDDGGDDALAVPVGQEGGESDPWSGDDELFAQLFGANVSESPLPTAPSGYTPTLLDPVPTPTVVDPDGQLSNGSAGDGSTTSYPLAPADPGPQPSGAPPAHAGAGAGSEAEVPPAALRAAKRLRKAYARKASF